ncbi:hypothetical protein ASE73_01980 [Sphingomonas sp. Leaf24]|uniref:hypothetical protein n=1 Tax=unclassified Sphingomonas TaxID=196159 RepID=UPI0006FF6A6F|nr:MULTISPECIES: hypothetical protein [unclassified Sphingomonas]KQM23018.1 hypothetical protein ASE50_01980 [Sphingomonas sp. Leaf5]KQM95876.1 hypothetical protein ASE73_01980 [Sphingomonas sp. Leaf24]
MVKDWKQRGAIYLWAYPPGRARHAGWHVSADPLGSASIVDLIDRLAREGREAHRTLRLSHPTDALVAVPGFGRAAHSAPHRLRIAYVPDEQKMEVVPESDLLILRLGDARLRDLRAAFVEVGIGCGDFALKARDGTAIWFWWAATPVNN